MRTIGDTYGPAMEIQTQEEADKYFESLVKECMGQGKTRHQAEIIQKNNLGYYAGYYDHETRARVERLFRCAHPIFGAIALYGPLTPEKGFEMGTQLGKKLKRKAQ